MSLLAARVVDASVALRNETRLLPSRDLSLPWPSCTLVCLTCCRCLLTRTDFVILDDDLSFTLVFGSHGRSACTPFGTTVRSGLPLSLRRVFHVIMFGLCRDARQASRRDSDDANGRQFERDGRCDGERRKRGAHRLELRR